MFEQRSGGGSRAEVIARFDELFERRYPSTTSGVGCVGGSDLFGVAGGEPGGGRAVGGDWGIVRLSAGALL